MKKTISNISWLFALLAVVTLGFAACSTDNDSNPTIDLSHVDEGFVLNVPANATNNTYDLVNAESLELTCSQPNYGGIPLAVRYYVQVSLESDFSTYTELSTSYTTADMSVDATELNNAIVELYQGANPDTDYPNEARVVYVKLRAVIDGTDGMGETYSNQISLTVLASYKAPEASFEEQLYVCGSSIQEAWTTWKVVPPVYGVDGNYYTMIYVPDGGSFKWGTYEQEWRGYDRIRTFNDEAGAGMGTDDDGNIVISNAGWYVLHFVGEIVGSSVQYDLNIYTGQAGVIGNAWDGGSWTEGNDMMTAPADASGEWESPVADGSGELRAYIKVGTFDWWRTEFTLYNGSLFWRLVDIADNWETNVGSAYSVQVATGQKLYVNFDTNTGYVQ